MMELTDSVTQLTESTTETRSPLGIDLNEIPSCPSGETLFPDLDALAVVRNYHDNLTPADGFPAEVPSGEERGEKGCAACTLPEVKGNMVVCDGCERGFHLSCAGKGRQPETSDEWVCGECVCVGVKSKRWPLGFSSNSSGSSGSKRGSGSVRLLDINALPPSDGEGEGSEELQDSRKHIAGGNSFGGNPFGAPVTYSSNVYAGNGFSFQRASGIMTHGVKLGFEDILHHTQAMVRSCEEVKFGFPIGMPRCSNDTAIRVQSRNLSEIFLQSLREFISERHGVLGEGWSVEVRQSMGSCELYAIYCAPDGKIFGSMSEVAYYLGLISNGNCFDSEGRSEGSASLQKRSHLNKRRKSTRGANGSIENKETFKSVIHKELPSDMQRMEICASEYGNNKNCTDSEPEGNGGNGCEQFDDALPLQYEDFFILSLGKIDIRPSYHDVSNIWPIGYRSCFHDKITGSFFICDVLDGGECGPIFRVKRCSCSTLPIPIGSTILFRPNLGHVDGQNEGSGGMTSFHMDSEEDESIQMILSEPFTPIDIDVMSCLGHNFNEGRDFHTMNHSQVEGNSLLEESRNILSGNLGLKDEIGEFSEEGRLPSSVWRMVCQKIIEACREIYKQTGSLKIFCKHFENTIDLSRRDVKDENIKAGLTSVAKFSSTSGYVNMVSMISVDCDLETLSNVLTQWLDQDRFGLDVEFVQEIIEQLPGVHTCSRYEFLNKRSYYPTQLTVGNGLLLVKTESGVQGKEEALNGLFRGCKRARTELVEDSLKIYHCPPVGKPLGTRLPSELVGDVLQVWEFFWRFYEILGLLQPLSFEELEEELISPWCDGLNCLVKFGREESQDRTSHGTGVIDGANGYILSSSIESGPALSSENLHTFIQMETGAMKEASQARLASITYSRCTGVVLTKAHHSLLKALVTELQSKVAGLVDPSFDAGEFKSRRGKRKDFDNSTISKKTKLNMLPINELTWPELARRYVLAVLTMDGNLDSPEITTRESGKVFRCLQGDGGVLCGSLTGVAGMKADALLLAEATKQIFRSLNRDSGVLTIEDDEPDAPKAVELIVENDGSIPEWAQVLEPVRKLPTNVGTRIRKCVYDALEKGPPEWAREILEHSISKGVYKGNASGPTKKAVLSVLAKMSAEGLQRQPEREREIKRKSVVSIHDIITKKCRIVLRRAATEDDAKFFCNLLGQNLMNSSDNDDEGLLGSPAMVSRPLDFRTIDLRLSVGAYGGSHEAFLEDVRELWNNVRTAFMDQPDLVELAETLSQKFESLYENEVLVLVQKLMEYAKLESLSAETKKEIEDIVVSTADIPKAPWDDGVCKVCGIDRDDDSVLLCDTCDAEYHTYCLNPPLARIPEGNWYCPSCVSGKFKVQEASGCAQVIGRRRRKYQGEYTRQYLEALANLAAVMEEKEYWEFNIDERTFLLKFLCDELLSSALVHQHLEQCAETSAELQQKIRSISAEWKNQFREEILVSRAARVDKGLVDAVGEAGKVDRLTTALPDIGKSMEPLHSDRPNYVDTSSDDLPRLEAGQEGIGHYSIDKQLSVDSSGRNYTSNNQVLKVVDSNDVHAIGDGSLVRCISFSNMASSRNDKSFGPNDLPLPSPLQQEIFGGISSHCNIQECSGRDTSIRSSTDSQGMCFSSEKNTHVAGCAPPMNVNESQAYDLELNSVKGDILLLQDSITSLESQLLKQTIRREFLGSDAAGRLYWVTSKPGQHPWVIVDGSMSLHQERKIADHQNLRENSETSNPPSIGKDTVSTLVGSKGSPFVSGKSGSMQVCSSWVSYQSDADIDGLIGWLKDNDPKERELKESVLQLRKLRFQDYQQTRNPNQEPQKALSRPKNSNKTSSFDSLGTKAATLLEKNYGPCFDTENIENLWKRGKKAKVTSEGKMYRCECLEPIWPSRHHCSSCHQTFGNEVELEGHNDGGCSVGPSASEKGKENSECSKGKGIIKLKTTHENCIGDMDKVEASKNGCPELTSRLIKFQNEGLVCPYDFEEICSKFVTKDSNKDLVQGIGLIGSNGVPSFVPSESPYLSDSTLMFVSQKEIGVPGEVPKAVEKSIISQGRRITINIGRDVADNSFRGCAVNNNNELLETDGLTVGCLDQKVRKPSLNSCAPEKNVGHCCVVSESSLRPLVGKITQILRRLKINLLDMDAALPEEALRPSKAHLEKRSAWRAFVKSAQNIFEMVQATIILEDMIKAEYLRNGWWYWSSLSAAAKISTISSLALRIYTLDAAIIYEKILLELDSTDNFMPNSKLEQKPLSGLDPSEKSKASRKASKRRKESEG